MALIFYHHNFYSTPPPLFERRKKKKKEKINQNDIWLFSSEVKPSHVENRPGTVLWVQKIGWASSSLGCNYLLKTKQNKKCTCIYIPPGTDIYLASAPHAFSFAMSELTALSAVYAASQSCQIKLVLMWRHRLAHRMQEMLPQALPISPAPPPLPSLKPPSPLTPASSTAS